VDYDRILAVQSAGRGTVKVFTSDTVITGVAGTLCELQKLLPSNFCYIKRDCIVNRNAINSFNKKTREIVVVCKNREYVFSVSRTKTKLI
jgi:DNA-binding LytR/AlgR family response regulator